MSMVDEEEYDSAYEDPIPTRPRTTDVDFSEYRDMGKVPWEKRMDKIRSDFPYIDQFDWESAFDRDMDLFGRIVRDILKLTQATPGRPGPRPGLDVEKAEKEVKKLFGQDHTVEPFHVAIKAVAPFESVRQIAKRAQIERNRLHRIMKGEREPDAHTLRSVAYAYGKHPSYFAEWRTFYITCALIRRLEWNPDATVGLYHKMDMQWKNEHV